MKKYIVEIEGMMCSMCESHINDAIRNNFNVKKVKSSHKKNVTIITAECLDTDKLKKVINNIGYKIISVS